jgi:hypothetical protein
MPISVDTDDTGGGNPNTKDWEDCVPCCRAVEWLVVPRCIVSSHSCSVRCLSHSFGTYNILSWAVSNLCLHLFLFPWDTGFLPHSSSAPQFQVGNKLDFCSYYEVGMTILLKYEAILFKQL